MKRDEMVAAGVAVAAFACSAAHIYSVAEAYGNHWTIAALHPLGIDGLIYVGLRNLKRAPLAGWTAAAYGATMSLAFNAASYADVVLWWPVMAGAMPLAMLLAFVVIHAGNKTPERVQVDHSVPVVDQVDRTTPDQADHSGPDLADQEPGPGGPGQVDQADPMDQAIKAVRSGELSIRKAADQYGVRRATLADRVKDEASALPGEPFQLPDNPEPKNHNGHAMANQN